MNPGDPLSRFIYGLPPASAKRHQGRLKSFLAEIGIDVNELQAAALEFVKRARENGGAEWAEHVLIGFVMSQNKRVDNGSIKLGTLETHYKAIKRFCRKNRIDLDWEMISGGISAADDRAPTADEIQSLIMDKDPRVKPIVYVMASCGIRLQAWDFLRWKHVEPKIGENGAVVAAKILVYAGQNQGKKKQYISFMTPQAYDAVKCWMDYRASHGETITEDSWVMRDLWQTSNVKRGQGNHRGLATNPKRLKSKGIKTLMDRALWRQGIRNTPAKRHPFKENHGYRKFAMSHMERVFRIQWELLI